MSKLVSLQNDHRIYACLFVSRQVEEAPLSSFEEHLSNHWVEMERWGCTVDLMTPLNRAFESLCKPTLGCRTQRHHLLLLHLFPCIIACAF